MSFRDRLSRGDTIIASFLKTPHPIVIEIMARAGLDTLVIDAEHAPFGRAEIDTAILAGRGLGMDMLVRVPNDRPDTILQVLDAGAAGIVVPHVNSAAQAQALARHMQFGEGGRGFAGTTRAAGYGSRTLQDHLRRARDKVALICQIEDPEGVENVAGIAAVDGVDALFVGRADLAVGSGKADFFDPDIAALTDRLLSIRDVATGLYCAPQEDLSRHHAAGARFFVIGSDHTAIIAGAPARQWSDQLNQS